MDAPRCDELDYLDFLVAAPGPVSCTEAARVQPEHPDAPAHDAFTRLLTRLEPDPDALWREAEPLVEKARGVLVLDDTTLDKPYAKHIALVTRHWSGKHKRPVRGIKEPRTNNLSKLLERSSVFQAGCHDELDRLFLPGSKAAAFFAREQPWGSPSSATIRASSRWSCCARCSASPAAATTPGATARRVPGRFAVSAWPSRSAGSTRRPARSTARRASTASCGPGASPAARTRWPS